MAEFDDDYYYDDYDDYDPAEEALRQQRESDSDISWNVLVDELNQAINSNPIPGVPWPEYVRRVFRVEYIPLPQNPTAKFLRNLYAEVAYANARSCADADDLDLRWWGGQFLFHRSEALGRWCYNTNHLGLIEAKRGSRGRSRFYCSKPCLEAGKKRHERNAKNPQRTERLRPMLAPGFPFSLKPSADRHGIIWRSDPYERKFRQAKNRGLVPQRDELRRQRDIANSVAPILGSDQAFSRWESGRSRKPQSDDLAALEYLARQAINDGFIVPDELRATLEETLGRSIESLITNHTDNEEVDEGPEPLSQRTITEIERASD